MSAHHTFGVETMRWDGTAAGAALIIEWAMSTDGRIGYTCLTQPCSETDDDHVLSIHTREGTMTAHPGDVIVKGARHGTFWPCRAEIFYDAATVSSK